MKGFWGDNARLLPAACAMCSPATHLPTHSLATILDLRVSAHQHAFQLLLVLLLLASGRLISLVVMQGASTSIDSRPPAASCFSTWSLSACVHEIAAHKYIYMYHIYVCMYVFSSLYICVYDFRYMYICLLYIYTYIKDSHARLFQGFDTMRSFMKQGSQKIVVSFISNCLDSSAAAR